MGLLDDELINECDKSVMNLDNMVTNFIQELFHTDKRVINNYGSNPSDRDYLLTRKCWENYYHIYLYKKTKPLARLCRQSEAYLSEWANMLFCFLIYIQQPQNVNF